jgi:hypothetical protein
MDQASILRFVVLAIGGVVGGNILGALTRGGGGVVGRTILGAIGGVGAWFAAANVGAVGGVTALWSDLLPGNPDYSAHLYHLITGAAGGGIIGLITGLLIRPRS